MVHLTITNIPPSSHHQSIKITHNNTPGRRNPSHRRTTIIKTQVAAIPLDNNSGTYPVDTEDTPRVSNQNTRTVKQYRRQLTLMEDYTSSTRTPRIQWEDEKHNRNICAPYRRYDNTATPPYNKLAGEKYRGEADPRREEQSWADQTSLIYLRWIKEDLEKLLRPRQHSPEEQPRWRKRREQDEYTGAPNYSAGTRRRSTGVEDEIVRRTEECTQDDFNVRKGRVVDRYRCQSSDEEKVEPEETHYDRQGRIGLGGMADTMQHRVGHNPHGQEHHTFEGRPKTRDTSRIPLVTRRQYHVEHYTDRQRNTRPPKAFQTHEYTSSRGATNLDLDQRRDRIDRETEREDCNHYNNHPTSRSRMPGNHLATMGRIGNSSPALPTYTERTDPTTETDRHIEEPHHHPTDSGMAAQGPFRHLHRRTPHSIQHHATDSVDNSIKQYQLDTLHERTLEHHPTNTLGTNSRYTHRFPAIHRDDHPPVPQLRELTPHADREHEEMRQDFNTSLDQTEAKPLTRRHNTNPIATMPHDISSQNTTWPSQVAHKTQEAHTRTHWRVRDTIQPQPVVEPHTQTSRNQTSTHDIQTSPDYITQHTIKTDIDTDTQTDAYLHGIWKAIHAYGRTIPLHEWVNYKQRIKTAKNIVHRTQQRERHTTNTRIENNYTQQSIHCKVAGRQQQGHPSTGQLRHNNTHPGNDPDTPYAQNTLHARQTIERDPRQGNETADTHTHAPRPHTRLTPHAPQLPKDTQDRGTKSHPHKPIGMPPTKPRNTISWADVVKAPFTIPPTKPTAKTEPTSLQAQTNIAHTPQPPHEYKRTPHNPPTSQQKKPDPPNTSKATPLKHNKQGTDPEMSIHKKPTQLQEHETALIQHWIWKTRKAENILTENAFRDREHINYYTNILAGPPAYLSDTQKNAWITEIHKTREKCRTDILIPALDTKANYWKKRRQAVRPIHNQRDVEIDKIIKHVWHIWEKKGFRNRDISKIFREANLYEDFIPAPPPPTTKSTPDKATTQTTETAPHTQPHPAYLQAHVVDRAPKYTTPPRKAATTETNPSKETQTPPMQAALAAQTSKQTTKESIYHLNTAHMKRTTATAPHIHRVTNQNTHTETTTGCSNTTQSERKGSTLHKHITPPSKERDTDTNTQQPDRHQTSPKVRNTAPNTIHIDTQEGTQRPDNMQCIPPTLNIHTPLRVTPKRHPTPIAAQTPKQHPTYRPKTSTAHPQTSKQIEQPPSTTNKASSKPQVHTDLTRDSTPRPSNTPSRTKALEDDIIFYTPIRHIHTPKQDKAANTHTPGSTTRTQQLQETHKDNPMQAYVGHPLSHRHLLQSPQMTESQPHKHSTGEHNTRNHHPQTEDIVIVINNNLARKNATQQKTTTATLSTPCNTHTDDPSHSKRSSDDSHTQPWQTHTTQHTVEHTNSLEPQHIDKPTRTPIHRISKRPSTTCRKDTQGGNILIRKTTTQHTQPTNIRTGEEACKTLCDETLEDIDWELVRQYTSVVEENTPTHPHTPPHTPLHTPPHTPPHIPPQPHQLTPTHIKATTNASPPPTKPPTESTTDSRQKGNIAEISTSAAVQATEQDTGNTNPDVDTIMNINHQTLPGGAEHLHIHRAIQDAIHRHTQAETPRHRREDHNNSRTGQDHTQAEQHAVQTKADQNKLRNLKRKYLREQRRLRVGTSKHKTNTDAHSLETKNTVFDYTTTGLTKSEREVLGLGKSFIITQNTIDIDRIKTDIATFIRRLRLHYIFRERRQDRTQTNQNLEMQRKHTKVQQNRQAPKGIHTIFRKPKSTFQPEETHRDINQIERNIEVNIAAQLTNKKRGHLNIPADWKTAIDTLKHRIADKEITITQADKGGGIIVVDYTTYIDKGTRYIEEEAEAYAPDYTPEELIIARLIKDRDRVTKQLKELDIIPTDTGTYATHQTIEKITGMKFYYKIHKSTDIHTMPVRPLQSCIGSPTQHISQVLTDIYEPYINNIYIPTHIRDTNHTLYELDGTRIRDNDTLAIADVVALYPSIEHDKGLKAIKEFTLTHIYDDEQKAGVLTEAFKLVITQNYVKWQGNIYKQTRGVAMGTPVAVTYANIYMNAVDNKIAETCTYIKLHRRFIDDNLFIIPKDKKEAFTRVLNNIDPPALKYTVTYLGDPPHAETIPFLDIKFYLNADRELYTRLYTKDTDKHQYLMPHSQHPRHIIRNIPRGVFARIRRLCKEDIAYQEDSELALGWLIKRGYKRSILTQIRQETGKKDRWQMIRDIEDRSRRTQTTVQTPTMIPFINTYSTPTKEFSNIIHNQQETLNTIFTKEKIKTLNAYRRKQNLGDLLMQPSLRIPIEGLHIIPRNFRKCGKYPHTKPCPCTGLHNQTQCRVCAHIDQDNIKIKTKIRRPITCDSKNLIYMIWCDACKLTYIGETQQKLRDRFTQHLRNLDIQDQEFYHHFKTPGHQALHMKIAVLETLQTDEPLYRKIKESTWITHLKTYTPHGLNSKVRESPLDALQVQPKRTTNPQQDHANSTHTLDTKQQTLDKYWKDNTQATTNTIDIPNPPTKVHKNIPRTPAARNTVTKQTNEIHSNTPRSPEPAVDEHRGEDKTQPRGLESQQQGNKITGRQAPQDPILNTIITIPDTHPKSTTSKVCKTHTQATIGIQSTQRKSTSVLTRQPRKIHKAPPQTQ